MKTHSTGIWLYRPSSQKIQLSNDLMEMFHCENLGFEVSFEEFLDYIIADPDKERFKIEFFDFINSTYEFGKSVNIEFRKRCDSGGSRFFNQTVFYRSEDEVLVSVMDITDLKTNKLDLINTNKNLEAISSKLDGIVANIKNGVVVFRAINDGNDFIYTSINKAASILDQVAQDDIIGKRITEVLPVAQDYGILDSLKRVWETGQPETLPLKKYNDGRIQAWRENYIFKIKTGEVVSVYSDLSELLINKREAAKYKTAVEQSANSIMITDTKGNIEFVNKKFCSLYGYSFQEVIGQNPRVLKSGNQTESIYKELWGNLSLGKSWSGEFENKAKDGSIVWVHANIAPIFDTKGNIINLLGIQEDITVKKKALQQLQFNEQKMRDIFQTMEDIVFQIDKNGIYKYIAPTNSEHLVLQANEIIGKSFYDIFPKDLASKFHKYINEALVRKETISREYSLQINNKEVWFETRISPTSEGDVTAIIRNISKRIKANNDLKKSELKFRNLFEQSRDAILLIKNGRFFECNQAALDMLEYKAKEQLLFKNPDDISPEFQEDGSNSKIKAEQMIKLAIKNGSHRFEWYHIKNGGQIFPVEVLLTSAKDFDGEMILHTVWRDITEQKNREKELIEAKEGAVRADKFKTSFLANMSHEIRTPMNGIIGFTELLSEPDLTDEEKEHFLKIIKRSGLNMLNIINDILDVSKIEAGEVDLRIIDHNVIETMNYLYDFFHPEIEQKGMKWIKDYDETEKVVLNIDQFKLNELLSNLIKNAIKYSHRGQINLGVVERDSDVLFYIKDTGIGIPYEKQEHVFDRFIQADNDITHMVYGTGLGLSICKAYVEMHQGEIWLESVPGKGSTFYFTIPKNMKATKSKPPVLN